MAIVTPDTNRVDSFAAAHDLTTQQVVRYNLPYFLENRTLWLPVGEDFNTDVPLSQAGRDLLVDGVRLLVNGRLLSLTTTEEG